MYQVDTSRMERVREKPINGEQTKTEVKFKSHMTNGRSESFASEIKQTIKKLIAILQELNERRERAQYSTACDDYKNSLGESN